MDVTWSNNRERVVDGKNMPDTNITVLFNDILRKGRHEIDPVERKALIEQLRKTEVPRSIVGNADVEGELASKWRKSTTPHNSPSSSKSPSSRKVGTPPQWIDWELQLDYSFTLDSRVVLADFRLGTDT